MARVHLRLVVMGVVFVVAASGPGEEMAQETAQPEEEATPAGMVWVDGGSFRMGTDELDAFPRERPAHAVAVDGFWIDVTEVTNRQFAEFVEATGYLTTAERAPTLEEIMEQLPPGTPPPPPDVLVAGSLVFVPPPRPVPLHDAAQWWRWTPGATWRTPEGPGSSIEAREDHPVVHVSWFDATEYAKWAGKRLPTEAEWEFAARGGLAAKRFVWGDEPASDTAPRVNIWQGGFPNANTGADGYERTAPAASFGKNGFGLHGMAGNVWEWCSDWYRTDTYAVRTRADSGSLGNPSGPTESFDPREPHTQKRVMKGGSFLCHVSYCEAYRPSARSGTSPDTSLCHVGFRCVRPGPAPG